jgi:hypothetical protein
MERIQKMFAALCFNCFFPGAHYCYSLAMEELKLHTLRMRRHRLDALFLTQVYIDFKFCPSALQIVGLQVPCRYIRDIVLFSVWFSCKNCPSVRCASTANVVSETLAYSEPETFTLIIFIICYNYYYYYYYYHYYYNYFIVRWFVSLFFIYVSV